MKGYKDYMNAITVDPILFEKIMKRTAQPVLRNPKRLVMRYAAMAACLAFLLMGIWLVPTLLNNQSTNGIGQLPQPPHGGPSGLPGDPRQDPKDTHDPPPPIQMHALALNRPDAAMPASRITPDGYFSYNLTIEQLAAVFPNLGLRLTASAMYRDDGSLWFVEAAEFEQAGKWPQYTGTQILLGQKGVSPDITYLIYDFTPVTSDVHGVPVTAFVFGYDDDFFQASFVLDGVAYQVQTVDSWDASGNRVRDGEQRLTETVNRLIVNGAADLTVLADPIIPELRNEQLTLAEARLDPDFGAFLPQHVPEGLHFQSANRVLNPSQNNLFAGWHSDNRNYDSIRWLVTAPAENDLLTLVSVDESHKYDVSLYPTPWAFSVPDDIHYYFQSPVFLWEEMNLDVVRARTRWAEGRTGATPRWETSQFGILYGNVLVQVSMSGLTPEQIWDMLPTR